jgi:hypothetical protein
MDFAGFRPLLTHTVAAINQHKAAVIGPPPGPLSAITSRASPAFALRQRHEFRVRHVLVTRTVPAETPVRFLRFVRL